MSLPAALAGEAYCYLTTLGRRTSGPHRIEIWFGASQDGSRLYVLSGGRDRSDWVRNLMAEPSVRLEVGNRAWDTTGHVVMDPEEDAFARRLLASKYQGWREGGEMSGWARTALPIAIDVPTGS